MDQSVFSILSRETPQISRLINEPAPPTGFKSAFFQPGREENLLISPEILNVAEASP